MVYTMTVDELFTYISKEIKIDELFHPYSKETQDEKIKQRVNFYKETIDFYGKENQHLKIKCDDSSANRYLSIREESEYLKGDELVYGDNLLFYYCGHDGFGCVSNFESKYDLDKWVCRFGVPKQDIYYIEKVGIFRYVYQDKEFIEIVDYMK